MFDWIRTHVLRVMRVPPDPAPPTGAPGSVRVFRAGRNYLTLRLLRWGLGQAGALVGILFSLGFLYWFKSDLAAARLAREQAALAAATLAPSPAATPAQEKPTGKTTRPRRNRRDEISQLAARAPDWVIPAIEVFELGGILLFLVQIPVSLVMVRLEFELHWYIVTDRSLRIRTGLLRLRESTMSFANLQQVEVKQDPLQRLLGLADVHVQSAGGGGDRAHGPEHARDSLHTGIFHSVDNATEIRDLILERLRRFRQAGLGDPEDHHDHAAAVVGGVPSLSATALSPPEGTAAEVREALVSSSDALAAAQELLVEARALRAALR